MLFSKDVAFYKISTSGPSPKRKLPNLALYQLDSVVFIDSEPFKKVAFKEQEPDVQKIFVAFEAEMRGYELIQKYEKEGARAGEWSGCSFLPLELSPTSRLHAQMKCGT